MDVGHITKDDLLAQLENIELYPELLEYFDYFLAQYVRARDLEVVKKLLEAGANPNARDDLDDYLLYLMHEYEVTKSSDGERVLALMAMLLEYGANANRVVMNNLRAYDYSVSLKVPPVKELLEKYGADKKLRKPV